MDTRLWAELAVAAASNPNIRSARKAIKFAHTVAREHARLVKAEERGEEEGVAVVAAVEPSAEEGPKNGKRPKDTAVANN